MLFTDYLYSYIHQFCTLILNDKEKTNIVPYSLIWNCLALTNTTVFLNIITEKPSLCIANYWPYWKRQQSYWISKVKSKPWVWKVESQISDKIPFAYNSLIIRACQKITIAYLSMFGWNKRLQMVTENAQALMVNLYRQDDLKFVNQILWIWVMRGLLTEFSYRRRRL